MTKLFPLLAIYLLISCVPKQVEESVNVITYPGNIAKVFDAHGGLDNWKKQRTLSYNIVTDKGREHQTIDIRDRREYIKGSNFIMGSDGSQTWIKADTSYNGKPVFYKNLMFYFYAMPFVLGDPGINYAEVAPLLFEGGAYPGIRISYDNGVGISPEDEYFLHYNPETYQMEWLGYTVTYFGGEKSQKISWIRYTDWQKNNDVLIPSELTWYNTEENKPTTDRSTRNFENVKLSKESKPAEFYTMIDGAKVAE